MLNASTVLLYEPLCFRTLEGVAAEIRWEAACERIGFVCIGNDARSFRLHNGMALHENDLIRDDSQAQQHGHHRGRNTAADCNEKNNAVAAEGKRPIQGAVNVPESLERRLRAE